MSKKFNRILKISWLIIGTVSLSYSLIQLIRGMSFNLSTAALGVIGLFMVAIFVLSKVFIGTATHFFTSRVFGVFKFAYVLFLALFLVLGVLILIMPLQKPSDKVDYMIILGAKVNANSLSLSLKNRLDRALEYISDYPDTPVILCGGQGADEPMTEALAMERYIQINMMNAESGLLIREEASTNTIENLKNAAQIISLREENSGSGTTRANIRILIVTSDFHVFRTKMLARRVGLNADVLAAETPLFVYPGLFVREIFAFMKSFVFDRV